MYQPCDIVLVRGTGWLARAIRFFTRRKGEGPTIISHTGLISAPGKTEARLIEALVTVVERGLWEGYGPPSQDEVAIARPLNLTSDEIGVITQRARSFIGRPYGITKIVTHWLDYFLGDRFVFRRLNRNEWFPICSYIVAVSYAEAGKNFGVDPGKATPDDIWDFCQANPGKYELVHPLGLLGDGLREH